MQRDRSPPTHHQSPPPAWPHAADPAMPKQTLMMHQRESIGYYHVHVSRVLIGLQRKLRNRMSQQAFRQRQVAYIRDLERRLARTGATENERMAELEAENQRLRKQLTVFINKLASAQASLQKLSQIMHGTLNESDSTDVAPVRTDRDVGGEINANQEEEMPPPDSTSPTYTERSMDLVPVLGTDQGNQSGRRCGASSVTQHESPNEMIGTFDCLNDAFQTPDRTQGEHTDVGGDSMLDVPTEGQLTLCDEVPGIWSYNYQMGPTAYRRAIEYSPPLRDSSIKCSNSRVSDHINSLRDCTWNQWQHVGMQQPAETRLCGGRQ